MTPNKSYVSLSFLKLATLPTPEAVSGIPCTQLAARFFAIFAD